jgi:hypothetical protein
MERKKMKNISSFQDDIKEKLPFVKVLGESSSPD